MFNFITSLFKPQPSVAAPVTSETSMNFDLEDVRPFLVILTNNPRFGLPTAFIDTIAETLPNLDVEQTHRWRIDGAFDKEPMHLEIEAFMDDIDAPDLSFHSSGTVIAEIDRELIAFADAMDK